MSGGGLELSVKKCTKCKEAFPATAEFFYQSKQFTSGLTYFCRRCINLVKQDWKRRNPEKVRDSYERRYYSVDFLTRQALARDMILRQPLRAMAKNLHSGVSARSKEIGLEKAPEFKSFSFFEGWLRAQPNCDCCGVEFHFGLKNGIKNDASPSIDRFDPAKGYTLENSELICWRCNNIKRNYTEFDLLAVAKWMQRRRAR